MAVTTVAATTVAEADMVVATVVVGSAVAATAAATSADPGTICSGATGRLVRAAGDADGGRRHLECGGFVAHRRPWAGDGRITMGSA